MPISDGMVHSANGKLKPNITMHGHYHLCSFEGGSMDWVTLKELKELNPIEVAKFAVANCVNDRNYTAMRTHVQWSVHLSALLIT
jgi:hypothetical protein